MHINITTAESESDLRQILVLQAKNLRPQLSATEVAQEGYVTVIHTLDLLKEMNAPYPHIIAKDAGKVVGYALAMQRSHGDKIPILQPMIKEINETVLNGYPLAQTDYILMGQICIDKAYRKQGLFKKLYEQMAENLKLNFQYLITEIADQNQRSLAAHLHTRFSVLKRYSTQDQKWVLVIRNLKSQ